MTNNKKGSLLKLGILAAGAGLVINELSKGSTNRSANVTGAIAGAIDTTDAAELIRTIEGSKVLQDYFKRLTAQPTAPTVQDIVTNINNSYTLDGVQYQNFGGSLLTNGAGEFGNAQNWTNENISIALSTQDYPIFSFSGNNPALNKTKVKANSTNLYSVSINSKVTEGNYIIRCYRRDLNGDLINISDIGAIYFSQHTFNNTNFERKKVFFGGPQNTLNSVAYADYLEFYILTTGSGVVSFKELQLNMVDLGEAVPSNLSWLPTGQEVYDSTTGDRGRYNGTTIDWYTMV